MPGTEIIARIKNKLPSFNPVAASSPYADEAALLVELRDFKDVCVTLNRILPSPVLMLFACDERREQGSFLINCVFVDYKNRQWITVGARVPQDNPSFDTLSKAVHSATLFEREIQEMFGIEAQGLPDKRRLRLHDEVIAPGNFPLRKDFRAIAQGELKDYPFNRVDGEGIFEVPVGPVHAGIIGPGHFRFSVAGEPIINLEIRLGFTHRGVEKLFEGKSVADAVRLAERVSGDASFAHSLAFTHAAEKICGVAVTRRAQAIRAICVELERMYNHANDIGGIAVDVGFSFPSAYASLIKEAILQLNEKLAAHRYLKGINRVGGLAQDFDDAQKQALLDSLKDIKHDFGELVKILCSSVSFMDRVDTTGVLRRKTAQDLGVVGLAARASGIPTDLRKYFSAVYRQAGFKMVTQEAGDVLARLRVRIAEFEESCRLIEKFVGMLDCNEPVYAQPSVKAGSALGYVEAWRGPVLYWLKTSDQGVIERCKIVDPSFLNWQGLSYAVLGNIIPDFPLCNKSFDLSYSGNDL